MVASNVIGYPISNFNLDPNSLRKYLRIPVPKKAVKINGKMEYMLTTESDYIAFCTQAGFPVSNAVVESFRSPEPSISLVEASNQLGVTKGRIVSWIRNYNLRAIPGLTNSLRRTPTKGHYALTRLGMEVITAIASKARTENQ